MYFWIKLFCLTFGLNVTCMLMYKIPEFQFNFLTLSHSGFLISWKPADKVHSIMRVLFKFGQRIKNDQRNTNFNFSDMLIASNMDHQQTIIHSLKEDTLYEIIIQQYKSANEYKSPEMNYTFELKTNQKTNTKPAKPEFIITMEMNLRQSEMNNNPRIYWQPCGRENNCQGKEAGTHFAIKFRSLDRRTEYRVNEYFKNYYDNVFISGIHYEVTVISVNDDSETESDVQEVYFQPAFGPVTSIKVISFPNASVLVSWKPPKYSFQSLTEYKVAFTNKNSIIYNYSLEKGRKTVHISENQTSAKILFDKSKYKLKPGKTYTISIVPIGHNCAGFETLMKYTIPRNKDD